MSTSHLILGSLISNNRGRRRRRRRRRRRQQDRPKSRSEKPKTLHVHNTFSYISLPSRHECGVKLRGREPFTWHRNYFHESEFMPSLYISLHLFTWYREEILFPYKSFWNEFIPVFYSGMKLTLKSYKQPLNFTFYGGRAHKTTIFFFFA